MDTQDISEDLNITIGDTQATSSAKCWAVLAPSSSSTIVPPKELVDDEIVVGRNSSCGVRLDDRRISSRHAKVYREPDGTGLYKVFIVDLSTNGTFLDRKRIAKNTPVKLHTGAEISLSPPDSNTRIAFLFQIFDTSYPQSSNTITTTSSTVNQHENKAPSQTEPQLDRPEKRPHEEEPVQSPVKKQKSENTNQSDANQIGDKSGNKGQSDSNKSQDDGDKSQSGDKNHNDADKIGNKSDKSQSGASKPGGKSDGESGSNDDGLLVGDGSKDEFTGDKKTKDEVQSGDTKDVNAGGQPKEEKTEAVKKENNSKDGNNDKDNQKDETKKDEESQEDKKKKEPEKDEKTEKTKVAVSGTGDAEIEEHLVCGICQSLFYKCVSIIPCLHNFCAYCIGEWCQRSNKCPECRQKVKGVSKNHIINNVVGGFLAAHPDKCRLRSELDDMDANCKITEKMLQKGKLTGLAGWDNHDHEEEEHEEDYSDEEDEHDEEDDANTCRQCRAPGHDGFQCADNGPHLMCSSCNQLVPDRPPSTDPLHPIPRVRCELCSRIHCDLYWGCSAFYGKGALKPLTEYQFTAIPPHTILNNAPELQYTLDILTFNHIAGPNGMWQEILKDLDASKLQFNGTPTHVPVTSNKISCQTCARTVFESLVYKWRAAVPADKVPALVAMRPNCHWGKNCRTQQHKQDHATKFNHICEQTKF